MTEPLACPPLAAPDQDEGCLLTHVPVVTSSNCLTLALRSARRDHDEVLFLSPTGRDEEEGHVVLRDRRSGAVREPGTAADTAEASAREYAATHGFAILGAIDPTDIDGLLCLPLAARAAAIAQSGGTLAAVAHRRFGIAGPAPILPQPPAAPPGGTSTDGQDTHVNAWLNALGGSVSQSDKDALAQTANDAQTLKSWFDSHKRGDPALNDMPQNVSDAENRLLSNPSISQQIHVGDVVTRDGLGTFIGSLDKAADSAKSSFQSFQKNNKDAGTGEVGAAAQASILQADLPILDASGSSKAKVDGAFNLDDLKAIATSSDSGVPDPLKKAAATYTDHASFDTLSSAGKAGAGLVDSGSLGTLISGGVGFSRQDSDIHNLVDDLGDAVSDDDKKQLTQVGDDATTLKSWFDAHDRGDPALNDMPKNVADAETRLLSNPAISKQIHAGDQVTRDALGTFLNGLNDAAKSAGGDWNAFKGSSNAGNPVAKQMAADATILRANLPVFDAAGSAAAKTDGLVNTDDLKAIASGDGSKGLPTALTNAAKLFSDPGMFHMLDGAGDNLAQPHLDGLADGGNFDTFVSKQAGTMDAASIGQVFSEAADRSMVGGVDTSKLGPDVFAHPENYSGAQKAAMIQQLQDLGTQVQAGVAQDNWVDTLIAGNGINTDYKQVQGDIAQKIAQLSGDPDVQKFRQDNYATSLQSIVGADPNLAKAVQSFYDGDVKNGTGLKDALGSKDGSGNTVSVEDGVAGFMQTANTLSLGLGKGGQPVDTPDFQDIAKKSGQQDAIKQAYEKDLLSGSELSDAIKNGTNLTTAIQNFQVDAANLGALLPPDYVAANADKMQQTFADTLTNGTLDYATSDDMATAFLKPDGSVDTDKLTDAITQAIKADPDLGKDSNGQPLSVSQVVSDLSSIINSNRGTVKLQDSLQKYAQAKGIDGPGKPTGDAADAYNRGVLHLMSAALTGGVLAAKEAGSSSTNQGYVDATRLGAGMQISGALIEGGTKYLKDTGNKTFTSDQLKTIESSGKVLGGVGGAIGGALGIFSGVESLKDGDKAGGAFGITNGITSLLSGVASTAEGGLALTGVGGETAAAAAGAISGGLGVLGGIVGALSAVGIGLYEGISAAVKNVQFTNQFVGDANRLGITGGTEDSNFPDPNTAPADNSPPP